MAPIIVVAIVAASLFGTGTVIKPTEPRLGTTLQFAGVGTMVGGGLGLAAGVGSGLATTIGTATIATTISTSAVIGGSVGGAAGAVYANNNKKQR